VLFPIRAYRRLYGARSPYPPGADAARVADMRHTEEGRPRRISGGCPSSFPGVGRPHGLQHQGV